MTVADIALVAATAKTICELGTTSTVPIEIVEWSVTFDGVTATNTPVKVEFQKATAGVTTATTYTMTPVDNSGGTAATVAKHSTTVEGAGTLSSGEIKRIPPSGGYEKQYPLGREWVLAVSGFWRIRCTAASAVNVSFHITIQE